MTAYECLDHPGPLDDATDHVCRLRPVRYPAGGCVLRDKTMCALPAVTCCDEGRARRWPICAQRGIGDHDCIEHEERG